MRYHHFTPEAMEKNIRELGVWLRYAAMVKAGQIDAEFKRGGHCRMCDAKPSCPLWSRKDNANAGD